MCSSIHPLIHIHKDMVFIVCMISRCIVSKSSRILYANGEQKAASKVKVGDLLMDAHGRPRRVHHVGSPNLGDSSIRSSHVRTTMHPNTLDLHVDTTVILDNTMNWATCYQLDTAKLLYPFTFKDAMWTLPDKLCIIPKKHGIQDALGMDNWQMGYLVGTVLTSGFHDKDNVIGIHFNKTIPNMRGHEQTLCNAFRCMDPTSEIHLVRTPTKKTVSVVSPRLYCVLEPIMHRDAHHVMSDLMCLNASFVNGVLDGLLESSHYFMDVQVYETILWCQAYCGRMSAMPTIKEVHESASSDDKFVEFSLEKSDDGFATWVANYVALGSTL